MNFAQGYSQPDHQAAGFVPLSAHGFRTGDGFPRTDKPKSKEHFGSNAAQLLRNPKRPDNPQKHGGPNIEQR
jgi:hypothetical protein